MPGKISRKLPSSLNEALCVIPALDEALGKSPMDKFGERVLCHRRGVINIPPVKTGETTRIWDDDFYCITVLLILSMIFLVPVSSI